MRQNSLILVPLKKMSAVFEQEFGKGEVAGIKLFMKMTDAEIDSLEAEISALTPKPEENEDDAS